MESSPESGGERQSLSLCQEGRLNGWIDQRLSSPQSEG